MTGPAVIDPGDPLEQLKALKAQPAAGDPLAALKAMRPASTPQPDENAPDPNDMSYPMRLATHILNTAQGIPGMEAFEAGAGALGSHLPGNRPISYGQSLQALREMTGNIGGKTSFAEHVLGTLPLMEAKIGGAALLPKNPALAGAALGAADQAFSANTDQSGPFGLLAGHPILARLADTALGGVLGYAGGRIADQMGTAAAAKIGTRANAATQVDNLIQQRSQNAAPLFAKAIAEGQGRTDTPAIRQVLQRPEVQEIVGNLLQTDRFKGLAPHDPRVLDAVYKVLTDQATALRAKVQPVAAGLAQKSANTGRYALDQIQSVQRDLVDAMSGGKSLPGPMPTYRQAVSQYANDSRLIDATQRGADALRTSRVSMPAGRNLARTTPEAFARWASKASPEERAAAAQGILGALKDATAVKFTRVLGTPLIPNPTRALERAPGLLRAVNPQTSDLARYGLLAVHAATQ